MEAIMCEASNTLMICPKDNNQVSTQTIIT